MNFLFYSNDDQEVVVIPFDGEDVTSLLDLHNLDPKNAFTKEDRKSLHDFHNWGDRFLLIKDAEVVKPVLTTAWKI